MDTEVYIIEKAIEASGRNVAIYTKTLGTGTYGSVKLAKIMPPVDKLIACKMISKSSITDRIREIYPNST